MNSEKTIEAFDALKYKLPYAINRLAKQAEGLANAMNRLADVLEKDVKPIIVSDLKNEKRKEQILKDFNEIGMKRKEI